MGEAPPSTYRKAFDAYIGLVRRTAYFAAAGGKLALRGAAGGLGLVSGQQGPELVQRLRAQRPRAEATMALDAILRGKAHNDPELMTAGKAMLTKAVSVASTSPGVPDEVVHDVLQIARDIHLDPQEVPVDPFTVNNAMQALKNFDGEQR